MSYPFRFAVFLVAVLFMAGCTSSQIRARKEQRDKVVQSAKLYCEFVNGELYPDVDVALNLEMAKRCDNEKPFSISQYKTPSENQGVIYCCSIASIKPPAPTAKFEKPSKAESKTDVKADAKADAKTEAPKADEKPTALGE